MKLKPAINRPVLLAALSAVIIFSLAASYLISGKSVAGWLSTSRLFYLFTRDDSSANLDPIPKDLQGQLMLFVIAGQTYRADGNRTTEDDDFEKPNPQRHVYTFGNDYHWKIAAGPVDDPTNQVDLVSKDVVRGYGPGKAFARKLLQARPDISIGLIPCTMAASKISEWQRDLSDHTLYGSCLKRVRAASTMGTLAGVLFMQGEADSIASGLSKLTPVSPDTWAAQFTRFVIDWRHDVGNDRLPVLFAQLGINARVTKFPNWDKVKSQQASVRLARSAMVKTDDIPTEKATYTTNKLRMIGERLAQAYIDLDVIESAR